jgi:uroporphyrinogen decarboxylase
MTASTTPLTSRQRIVRACKREKPDKVPKDLSWGMTPTVLERFKQETGSDDPDDYFGVDIRFIGLDIPPDRIAEAELQRHDTFAHYYPQIPVEDYRKANVSEWGTAYVPGSFYHFTQLYPPMLNFTTLADFEAYPLPRFTEDWRLQHARERIKVCHQRDLAVGGAMAVTIFEVAWQMRGMPELFEDFRERPELAEYLLEHITEARIVQARFFAEHNVDVLILGDDVSMQTGMLMSPATWRTWFKERMRRIIQAATAVRPDIPVFYHSDGNPSAIIPELIEIGVTVLNPVQPECIDPVWVKQRYGDRLALWGTIGTQTTMPFGTVEDVRHEVRQRIETLGYDGGLVLGPTHSLEPDVPWENIVALYEAIEEFG